MRCALAALLVLTALASAQAAAAPACPSGNRPRPNVTVAIEPARINYRNSVSQRDLTQQFNRQRRVDYGASRKATTVGLTRAEGGYETRAHSLVYALRPKTSYCGWLSGIEVRLFFKSMMVDVASEYRPGSCEYTAVIDHEDKHVAIFRNNMAAYAKQIKVALDKAAAAFGPAYGASESEVTRQFMKEAGRIIKPYIDQMHEQSEREHARLDSPQSYQSTQNLCRNWKF